MINFSTSCCFSRLLDELLEFAIFYMKMSESQIVLYQMVGGGLKRRGGVGGKTSAGAYKPVI